MTAHPLISEYIGAEFELVSAAYWHSLSHDFHRVGTSPREIALLQRPQSKEIYDILVQNEGDRISMKGFHEHEKDIPLCGLVQSIGSLFTAEGAHSEIKGPEIIRAVQRGGPDKYQVSYK